MAYRQLQGLGIDAALQAQARQAYDNGQVAFTAGQYSTALTAYQSAYSLTREPQVLVAIGASLERLGRYEEARQDYQSYLWADPSGPAAQLARDGIARVTPHLQAVSAPSVTVPPGVPEEPSTPPALITESSSGVFGDSTTIVVLAGAGLAAVAVLGVVLARRRVKTNRRRRR